MPSAVPTLRTLLFRLHWALGLTAGFILAVVGLTGALLSYEEAITALANRDRSAVTVEGGRAALTPAALIARIEADGTAPRVAALTLFADPTQSVIVRFARDRVSRERPISAYVDPADATVRGSVRLEGVFGIVRSLHRWLLLPGDGRGWGRTLTGAATLALLIFLGTGLYLRWPGRHGWRVWLKPRLARPGRARWWSLHAVVGTWLVPVYTVIALSGLWWSYDWYRTGAAWLLTGQVKKARPAGPVMPRIGQDMPAASSGLDQAWAHFAGRGAAMATVTVPDAEAQTIRIRWYGERGDNLRDEAVYDARTGVPVSDRRSSETGLGQRIADNMLEVHRGRFFGAPVALLFCLSALAVPGFLATGLVLYWLRRRVRRHSRQAATHLIDATLVAADGRHDQSK